MTPDLDATEEAAGTSVVPVLPQRFSDLEHEWSAVRQRCGLLDARFRGMLRMTGSDRVSFLQGMVSNDVAKLQVGEGTYAALLTQQGRVVSDLRIYVLDEELWLDVPAARIDAVRAALEQFIIADDVEFAADDAWAPLVAIEGPQATRVLLAISAESMDDARLYTHRRLTFDGTPLHVAVASHAGERGYLLFGPSAVTSRLWEHCRAAGAEPVGMEALNVLRVEAGIPWYGSDMDESMLISEVGLDAAISFQKGCYLGQEVVERVAARGQVHRKLVGVMCDGREVPAAQTKVECDGKEVGWVTSAVWSPAREAVVALAYVRREHWDVGTELRIASPAGEIKARVEALPFYSKS